MRWFWGFLSRISLICTFFPWSPESRQIRIKVLMDSIEEEYDIAAAIVYYRDLSRGMWLEEGELNDFRRIAGRLKRGEIILPADRS